MLKNKQQAGHIADLSRREREIMDIIFSLQEATVTEVLEAMEDPPSYSAVRSTLNIMQSKGHLTHRHDGNRYVYLPTTDLKVARSSALDHVLKTFFGDSTADAVTALLEERGKKLSEQELARLSTMIRRARKEGR
jgi:BlaI family penicillinase repressor